MEIRSDIGERRWMGTKIVWEEDGEEREVERKEILKSMWENLSLEYHLHRLVDARGCRGI